MRSLGLRSSGSHDSMIRVYDAAGKVIEMPTSKRARGVRTSNFPDEHYGSPRIRNIVVTGVEGDLLTILRKVHASCETRVNRPAPSCALFERRQAHPLRRKVGVVDKEETLARELAALGARIELNAERARFRIVPVQTDADAVGAEPTQIGNLVVVQILAEHELAALQDWIAAHERDRLAEELDEVVVL